MNNERFLFVCAQNQPPSPSGSPFLCRQRNANSRNGSDVETGKSTQSERIRQITQSGEQSNKIPFFSHYLSFSRKFSHISIFIQISKKTYRTQSHPTEYHSLNGFFVVFTGSLLEPTVTGKIVASPEKDSQTMSVWQTKSTNSDNALNRKNCSINNSSSNFIEIQLNDHAAHSLPTLTEARPPAATTQSLAKRFRLAFKPSSWMGSRHATSVPHIDALSSPSSPSNSANDFKQLYGQCKHHIINWVISDTTTIIWL